MEETTMVFIDGVGTGIETVHMELGTRDAILAVIFRMLKMGGLVLLAPG